jgi:hypothetical protein
MPGMPRSTVPAISRHPNLIVVLDKGGTGCDERLLNCVNG